MDGITIRIWKAESEEGYFYDIFDTEDANDESEAVDGGLCTGTFEDAIGMASEQAITIINKK